MVSENFIPIKILSESEKGKIVSELNEQFGIGEIDGTIIMKGREKMFLFSGSLGGRTIKKLEESVVIERVGVYFAKIVDDKIKLSIEGVNLLKNQISKNIFDLDESSTDDWIRGRDLNIKTGLRGFLVMRHGSDFLGTGKASENKIGNFIPKSRRVK
ncbi:MAG: hypothetical protein Q8P81_02310 [Nanoarchaeota archaeon]|nr:hypothetical protein [Nanoarchaeota archaeon]